ncbi:MAG: GNAT family N-acyltransferase [Bryobacteraceae bacterium]
MQTAPYRFQLLAPAGIAPSAVNGPIRADIDSYEHYLTSLQKLRAQSYIADGAIGPDQLDGDGRFRMHWDEESWHFLLVNPEEEVVGCVRYLAHQGSARAEDLFISHSAIAKDPVWGARFLEALESDLTYARENLLTFIEVGGWAIETGYRHTRAALEILLASFAWARSIGGAIGCCTATFRNSSAPMLRRIGGRSFEHNSEAIPPYNDAHYGCMMEALRFHFQDFDPRFQKMVDSICDRMTEQSTIARSLDDAMCLDDAMRTTTSLQALNRGLQSANKPATAPVTISI